MISDESLVRVPLLIICNKQDLPVSSTPLVGVCACVRAVCLSLLTD